MKVFVNGHEVILFRGAKVKDALLGFDSGILSDISLYEVLDAYGNRTEINGALQNGCRLFVRKLKTKL